MFKNINEINLCTSLPVFILRGFFYSFSLEDSKFISKIKYLIETI